MRRQLTRNLLLASAAVIRVRLGEVTEYAPAILDPANVTELHDMRIAVKRLRYTLEVFAPALPPDQVTPRGAILEMLRMVREVEPARASTKLSTADDLPNIARETTKNFNANPNARSPEKQIEASLHLLRHAW